MSDVAEVVDNMAQSKAAAATADALTPVDLAADPGLTTRGWSPEVTARHPKLVAATMAELAGGAGAPTDAPVGDLGPHKTWLRNAAINLNYKRLTEGLQAAAGATPTAAAAFAEAVAEAEAAIAPAPEPAVPVRRTERRAASSDTEPKT